MRQSRERFKSRKSKRESSNSTRASKRVMIYLTTFKSWLSSCTSLPVQLVCTLENLNIPDLKLRTRITTAHTLTERLPKLLSIFMQLLRIINTWLAKSWNLAKAYLTMLSKQLKKSLFLRAVSLCPKEVKELRMEKNLKLRPMVLQRTNWWIFNSTFTFLRLSENHKCTSIEYLVLVLTWQSLLSIILASLRKPSTNLFLTTTPSLRLFRNKKNRSVNGMKKLRE